MSIVETAVCKILGHVIKSLNGHGRLEIRNKVGDVKSQTNRSKQVPVQHGASAAVQGPAGATGHARTWGSPEGPENIPLL